MTSVTGFVELTDSADEDLLGIIDDPSGTPLQKKITGINYRGALTWKNPVRIGSTADLGLSGLAAIDGITPVAGDRVLAKDQSTGSENGIYDAASGAWTRSNDFDTDNKATGGAFVTVQEGTVSADKLFQLTTIEPITLGSTALVFAEFSGGGGGDDLGDHTATQDLLMETFAVQFGVDAAEPAGTIPYITHLSGGMEISTPSGQSIILAIAGNTRLTITNTLLTTTTNFQLGVSDIIIMDGSVNKTFTGIAEGLEFDTDSGLLFRWRVGNITEYEFDAIELDMKNNNLLLGTGQILVDTALTLVAGKNIVLQASGALGLVTMGELTTPATPGSNTGSFYVKDVSAISTPFFIGDDGVEKNLTTAGAEVFTWTADHSAGDFNFLAVPVGSTDSFLTQVEIAAGDDTGSSPVVEYIARRDTPALLSNRDAFAWYNHTQQLMVLSRQGNLDLRDRPLEWDASGVNHQIHVDIEKIMIDSSGAADKVELQTGGTVRFRIEQGRVFCGLGIDFQMDGGVIRVNEISTPSTPIANKGNYYAKDIGGTSAAYWMGDDGVEKNLTAGEIANIEIIIDGGGSVITTGVKADIQVDFPCTIEEVTLLADVSGSIVVDIFKDTFANFPAVVGDSITASAKPTISSSDKSQDSTLTGWTTAIVAGDHIRFNVDSATTITRVTLALKIRKT